MKETISIHIRILDILKDRQKSVKRIIMLVDKHWSVMCLSKKPKKVILKMNINQVPGGESGMFFNTRFQQGKLALPAASPSLTARTKYDMMKIRLNK